MATGKASDFTIYQDELRGGIVERLTQASAFFNAAGGAIRLGTVSRRGDYAKESFFKTISSLVSRRDTTSVAAATDLAVTMGEMISVKLNRKIGPIGQTLDAFRKIQMEAGDGSLSFLIGTQIAKALEVDMLNNALRAARAALDTAGTTQHDATASTLTTAGLVSGLAKFGDAGNRIGAWVMHSKVYYDLMQHQIGTSANGDIVAGVVVQGANPLTLNRPVIVTDSDALVVTTGTGTAAVTTYHTLGLVQDAVVVEDSESSTMEAQIVTGLENLVVRLQGESAYNLGVKGFKWDVTNGGVNPSDSAVGTGSNWDAVATSYKDWAGVLISSD
jgi:hypothetical protein